MKFKVCTSGGMLDCSTGLRESMYRKFINWLSMTTNSIISIHKLQERVLGKEQETEPLPIVQQSEITFQKNYQPGEDTQHGHRGV